MRKTVVALVIGVIVVFALPAAAQQRWVSDFTSISVTPVVTGHSPVTVDVAVTAVTSGYWTTSTYERVLLGATLWNSSLSWSSSGSTWVSRSPGYTWEHTFSFTLPDEGNYDYAGWAFYASSFVTYSTSASGVFTTISRAGIPALGGTGMLVLGLLLAGTGILLLRRA